MRYLGGKCRVGKDMMSYINQFNDEYNVYVELCVGACWSIQHSTHKNRVGLDSHLPLISMWKAVKDGWLPPINVSEAEYAAARDLKDTDPLKGFIGFACSFGGKWFGGYARDPKSDRNYAKNAFNSIIKKVPYITNVDFDHFDLFEGVYKRCLIYVDPPYEGTTKYSTQTLDYKKFWERMRELSADNKVLISSYQAPNDFVSVWSQNTKTDLGNNLDQKIKRIEYLFEYKGK